jgi:arginine-tRNA-protein transferase
MLSLFTFNTVPNPCGYLPNEEWSLFYEVVGQMTPDEYQARLNRGWRRFGYSLFRPDCPKCKKCRSLRVPVATFKPDRSQRRAWAANENSVVLEIGQPSVTDEKIQLYDRFHAFQHFNKGWPEHGEENPSAYFESFVANPFETEEWRYTIDGKLVGVGYVDHLPNGYSAIYFFHDPDERNRSLGTFNVLSILKRAAQETVPYVYLGYFVDGCRSLEYKSRFRPNEVVGPEGLWLPFRQ